MTGRIKSQKVLMRICAINQLTDYVFQILLCSADEEPLIFYAGQYLMLHYSDKCDACAYSIASSPVPATNYIELHIECRPDSKTATEVMQHLKQHSHVEITFPKGNCFLNEQNIPATPLIFIAASTGFAQMKSMIEFIKTTDHAYPKWLYWGVKHHSDFYITDLPILWEKEGFIYHPVVSNKNNQWKGRFGLLYEALLEDDCPDFHNAHIYIGGSSQMVNASADQFIAAGFSASKMHSDALLPP